MKNQELKNYRIHKPMDYLHRRLFLNNGPLMHELFNFQGTYEGPCPNKILNGDGSISEVDIAYLSKIENSKKKIINVEDETNTVNEKTLKKLNKYKINLQYTYGLPVLSVITTTLPRKRCLKELKISSTELIRPIIISYLGFDGEKDLNTLKNKILNNEPLTRIEFIKLILVIKTFKNNHSTILESICNLVKKAKIDDVKFKMEMVYCSRYIIHKYARTTEDIIRLEEAIGLKKAVTCGSIIDDIKNEGIAEGIDKGKLNILNSLANDPNSNYTVEELAKKFGFTVEQILNGE